MGESSKLMCTCKKYIYIIFTDIGECSYGLCNQLCINSEGSYTCDCNTGYNLLSDNSTCEGIYRYLKQNIVTLCRY